MPDFIECDKSGDGGLTSQQWSDLRLEGLQRPDIQQRLYRYSKSGDDICLTSG